MVKLLRRLFKRKSIRLGEWCHMDDTTDDIIAYLLSKHNIWNRVLRRAEHKAEEAFEYVCELLEHQQNGYAAGMVIEWLAARLVKADCPKSLKHVAFDIDNTYEGTSIGELIQWSFYLDRKNLKRAQNTYVTPKDYEYEEHVVRVDPIPSAVSVEHLDLFKEVA